MYQISPGQVSVTCIRVHAHENSFEWQHKRGRGREMLTRWRAYLFRLWQDVAQSAQLLGAQRLAVAACQVRHHLRRRDAKLTQEDVHLEALLVLKQRNLSTSKQKPPVTSRRQLHTTEPTTAHDILSVT